MAFEPFSAVVLAAGRSTRMGRDKALLEIDGKPLWRRQCEVLAAAGATEIFLSARPEQAWTRGADRIAAVLHDALPDCGPMAGVTAAIERSTQPLVAALAVDLPAITAEWFMTLRAACTPTVGMVARRGKFFEPLAAIYPRAMLWLAREALGRGEYSFQRLVEAALENGLLRVREITEAEAPLLANWNRNPAHVPGGE